MIDYRLKFGKMEVLVRSILLWQQLTKNFEIDKRLILRDLDQLVKIQH